MDTKHLISFLKIVDTGSFSDAAENLYMTQSAISKQIAALEAELGFELFDRTRRRVQLTEHGEILATEAPRILAAYYQTLDKLSGRYHELRIGVFPSTYQYGGMKLIAEFSRQNPDVAFSIVETENAAVPQALNNGEIDFAFCRLNENENYRNITIFSDVIALVLPKSHPLANKKLVSLSEFKEENFIFLTSKTGLYKTSIICCEQAGFSPKIVFTGDNGESIMRLVEEGIGIAMIMKQVALGLITDGLTVVDFIETKTRCVTLTTLADKQFSENEKRFWNFVRDRHK